MRPALLPRPALPPIPGLSCVVLSTRPRAASPSHARIRIGNPSPGRCRRCPRPPPGMLNPGHGCEPWRGWSRRPGSIQGPAKRRYVSRGTWLGGWTTPQGPSFTTSTARPPAALCRGRPSSVTSDTCENWGRWSGYGTGHDAICDSPGVHTRVRQRSTRPPSPVSTTGRTGTGPTVWGSRPGWSECRRRLCTTQQGAVLMVKGVSPNLWAPTPTYPGLKWRGSVRTPRAGAQGPGPPPAPEGRHREARYRSPPTSGSPLRSDRTSHGRRAKVCADSPMPCGR